MVPGHEATACIPDSLQEATVECAGVVDAFFEMLHIATRYLRLAMASRQCQLLMPQCKDLRGASILVAAGQRKVAWGVLARLLGIAWQMYLEDIGELLGLGLHCFLKWP